MSTSISRVPAARNGALLVTLAVALAACSGGTASPAGSAPSGSSPAGSAAASAPGTAAAGGTTWDRIQAEKLITFGFANEPPYTIAETGNVTGQDPDTLKAVLTPSGVETYNGVLTDFAGLIPALLAKRLDAIAAGMIIRPARCEQVAFSNPNLAVHQGLVVKAGNPKNLHSLKDVAADPSVKIGLQTGSSQYEFADVAGIKADQILGFPDAQRAFAALQAGRVDATEFDLPLLKGQLEALADPSLELASPFETPLTKDGKPADTYVGVAFRKEDTDLVDAYNEGLAKIVSDGTLQKTIEKYGFSASDVPAPGVTSATICAGG